MNKGVCDQ